MVAPDDIAPKRGPEGNEWITVIGFVVLVFGLFAAEVAMDFDARKYGALMVFVLWAPLLVIHELGHALAARLVGWRVLEIVIGFGKPVKRFHVGGTRIELRMFPLEGFVVPAPRTLKGAPWKNAFVYFAGPGVELAFIGVAGWIVGFDRLLTRTDDLAMVTLQAACVVAAMGAIMNLAPFPLAGGLVSDGLGIILSFLSRPEHYAAGLARPYVRAAEARLREDDIDGARAALEEGLREHESSPWLTMMAAVVQAAAGDGKGAFAALEMLGHPKDLAPALLADAAHARARIALESLDDDLLVDADRFAELALAHSPGDVQVRVTRGATLLERMRYPEASRILSDAAHDAHDLAERERALGYLAILEWRRGRQTKAHAIVDKLRAMRPGARVMARVSAEMTTESMDA